LKNSKKCTVALIKRNKEEIKRNKEEKWILAVVPSDLSKGFRKHRKISSSVCISTFQVYIDSYYIRFREQIIHYSPDLNNYLMLKRAHNACTYCSLPNFGTGNKYSLN
jgi:hypothetical protein